MAKKPKATKTKPGVQDQGGTEAPATPHPTEGTEIPFDAPPSPLDTPADLSHPAPVHNPNQGATPMDAHTDTPADLDTQSSSAAGQIQIQGFTFGLPALPYSEGHVLNALEAAALNQTWSENLRNNFASQVKKALGEGKTLTDDQLFELTTKFAEYAASYSFSVRATRTPIDPVGAEAHKIAKQALLAALKSRNINPKSLAEGKMEELVQQLISTRPEIKAEAERRIAASRQASSEVLASLGIG